ncbi:hypothetical protein NOK12_16500 [Nocardioides sp. OK12]|nr:hypothetical protein NOK12_16500 [Nocardioides sp. OK12]
MTIVFPDAVKAQGNLSVTVIPAASLSSVSAPSVAELAAEGVNVSMYMFTGAALPTKTTATGEAPRRLGSKEMNTEFGTTTRAIADLSYVYDPQAAPGASVNAARDALVEGSKVYIVYRWGVDAEQPLAAGDKVDIWEAELGPQNKGQTGDGDFDQLNIVQSVISNTPPAEDVALVA